MSAPKRTYKIAAIPAAGGDNLFSDAVGGDGCDLVRTLRCGHRVTPGGSVRWHE